MNNIKVENITTTGKLAEILNQLPDDIELTPFGSSNVKLVYIENEGKVYIDEDFSFLSEEVMEIIEASSKE